jgi:hypothetical protein
MASAKAESSGTWLRPLSALLIISALFVVIPTLIDALALEDHDEDFSWIQNLPEVFAGVLGIAVTVVAIIVELASNRYTSRITELFFKAGINSAILGFFIVSCVQCVWVSFQTSDAIPWAPVVGTYVALASVTLSLVLLLPYFVFVFSFLNPRNVIRRIREDTLATIREVRAGRAADLDEIKARVIDGVEQIADIALNAIENKDKAISMGSVDALRELTFEYFALKPGMPDAWFDVTAPIAGNPDFVSMTPDTQLDLKQRKLWLEMKVFRQYQMLYNEALNRTRDLNYLIAINTRLLGERMLADGDSDAHWLAIKFFNTYLRQTINSRDVRTAYNVLNQYRLLAENALTAGATAQVEKIAFYFKYYGLVAFNQGLPFVLETVAYDLCSLNELAHDLDAPNKLSMLADFLEVDKESEVEHEHEATLRGVRKAQVKLATYYLVKGATDLARKVWKDMKDEVPERLISIKQELVQIQTKEYWEVIDRGANFDYLEPRRREKLEEFFSWFGEALDIDPGRPSTFSLSTRTRTSA